MSTRILTLEIVDATFVLEGASSSFVPAVLPISEFFEPRAGIIPNAVSVLAGETPVRHTNVPRQVFKKDGTPVVRNQKPFIINNWTNDIDGSVAGPAYLAAREATKTYDGMGLHVMMTGRPANHGVRSAKTNRNKPVKEFGLLLAAALGVHPETAIAMCSRSDEDAIRVAREIMDKHGGPKWNDNTLTGAGHEWRAGGVSPLGSRGVQAVVYNQTSLGPIWCVTYDGTVTMEVPLAIYRRIEDGPGFTGIGRDGHVSVVS